MTWKSTRIGHEELRAFCTELLKAVGVPAEDAEVAATVQVEADLRGVYSHGSRGIPGYARSIQSGRINPRPQITVISEGPSYVVLDGDYGLGQVVSVRAMGLAIKRAKTAGITAVGALHSNHFGAAAYYSMMASAEGMIGFSTTSGASSNLAAYGGITPIVGNLPLSYAIPAGEERAIVLDMASGTAAHGKISLAKMAGELLPAGFFMTREGVDTRDPEQAAIVLPAAGPKGYGLALVMDILAGVMLGDVASCHKVRRGPDSRGDCGHFFQAINIESFRNLETFKAEVDRQIRTIRASKTRPGVERVYLPGERSWLRREEQLENGVSMPVEFVHALEAAGKDLGVKACWNS